MSDNTSLVQRIEDLEVQLRTLREAAPIRSIPGNTIAIKALLNSLLSAKVPEERDAIIEVARNRAQVFAANDFPVGTITDIDGPFRRQMNADIDAFFESLRSA